MSSKTPETKDSIDIVGDRQQLLSIGMVAVFAACVIFGALRLIVAMTSGRATPWWGNATGAVVIAALYVWYRRDPLRRSSVGVHGTALTATVALLVPAAYGLGSSKWWLALVGFAVMLMGRRAEAVFWGVATLILIPLTALVEPRIVVANAIGEPAIERAMAGLFFVALLLGITWAFRRVAEQRAMALTQMSESLTRANRVKTRFLAHMSHEVRTPLHGMIAMTDLALKGSLPKVAREQIETAQQSAHILVGLLNNILDVTRAEADAIELEHKAFSLHNALAEVLRPLAGQARAAGLGFSAQAAAGLIEERVGDRMRVMQIVLNLVANALKFTRIGCISVSVRGGSDDSVEIEVSDTGGGVVANKLSAIFEPFAQSSAADAQIQGGAGLGLAIVKDLTRRMEGNIDVESTVGVGSRFTARLKLPCKEPNGAAGPVEILAIAPPSSPGSSKASRGLTILVCEDNEMVQKVFRFTLTRLGHKVTLVDDGAQAWELLTRQHFDLVLTDVDMPGLSGIELTRRLRRRERETGGHMPVVAATGHAGKEDEERVLAAGADAFLAKPFDLTALSTALARALGNDTNSAQSTGHEAS